VQNKNDGVQRTELFYFYLSSSLHPS